MQPAPEVEEEKDETIREEGDEAQVDEAARQLLAYALSEGSGEKVRAVRTRSVFGGEDEDIDTAEFTERAVVLMADADPSHLRHVILADPDAELDQVMAHLRLLYGPAASISLTEHGDTEHRHFHAVILTVDPATGKGFQINKGFDIEALHMLAAGIDFENSVTPEPNALYLADEAAIYDRWTGVEVASRKYEIDPTANVSARRYRTELMNDNEAADHADERWKAYRAETNGLEIKGPEWDDERVAKLMVAPRIKRAASWQELHESLAHIGIQYVDYRGNGRLLLGEHRHIAASKASSSASMTELRNRFGIAYQPPMRPELLRAFVCPRFTMREVEKSEARDRQKARAAVDAEAERIAQLADEELQALRKADRERALKLIREVTRSARSEQAKKSKLNSNRREAEREADRANGPEKDQPEAIAWPLDHRRMHLMIDVYAGYDRKKYWGAQQWRRNGNLEFIEYRTFITAMKGADKLQMLKLAQLKWGEDFKVFGSKREIEQYCRLAAKHDIVFGDETQRRIIDGYRVGMSPSAAAHLGKPDPLWDRIGKLTGLLNAQVEAGRAFFDKALAQRPPASATRKRDATPLDHAPAPSDRRGMIRIQEAEGHADEVIRDYEQPVGQSATWLQEALAKNPEDLAAPPVQGYLLAIAYRQQAERDILLVMLSRGQAAVENGKVVCNRHRDRMRAALERENDNPEFLKKVFGNWVPEIQSENPDIQAYASASASASKPDSLHDLTIARQALAFRLLQKAGKGKKRASWLSRLKPGARRGPTHSRTQRTSSALHRFRHRICL